MINVSFPSVLAVYTVPNKSLQHNYVNRDQGRARASQYVGSTLGEHQVR